MSKKLKADQVVALVLNDFRKVAGRPGMVVRHMQLEELRGKRIRKKSNFMANLRHYFGLEGYALLTFTTSQKKHQEYLMLDDRWIDQLPSLELK